MKRVNVFFTRSLGHESIEKLYGRGLSIEARSLMDIQYLPINLPVIERGWLFFYSKNGVKAFLNAYHRVPAHLRVGVFGSATAKSLETTPHFIGEGSPKHIAHQFSTFISPGEKVIFIRASQSRQSVQSRLPQEQVIDIIGYKNEVIAHAYIPDHDIVVLTSPLNTKAYLSLMKGRDIPQTFIAIGETTANAVYTNTGLTPLVPDQPTEECLVDLVINLQTG